MNFFCFWLVYGLYQWFISETGQLDSPIVVETTWWIPGRWRCRWRRWCGASWTAKRMDPQGCFSADFFNGWMSWKMVLSRRFHHQKWWFPWDFYGFMASKMVISWELTSKNGDSIGFNLIFTIFTWWFDRIDVIKHGDFSIREIGM